MEKNVFQYRSYKAYMRAQIAAFANKGRGKRRELSQALNCQTAYVSQVLNQEAHFSLEQAMGINQFFHHSKAEAHFFLLLLQLARAGSSELKSYFEQQIEATLTEREQIQNRIKYQKVLDERDQNRYYSTWYYCAVHVLLSIPGMQTKAALARHLNLNVDLISGIIDFLVEIGIVEQVGNRYQNRQQQIHLGRDSIQVLHHHNNWRTKALEAIQKNEAQNLHFTSVFSLSKADFKQLKDIYMNAIEQGRNVIAPSSEEVMASVCLDIFVI